MKLFEVSFGSKIVGSNDCAFLMANDANEALEMGKKILNAHKLVPSFLNDYGRWHVTEVQP